MNKNQFERDFCDRVAEGTTQLIDSVKLILYKKDNTIFEKLDFENDEIYLEPILFAGLNSKLNIDINSLFIGYQNKEVHFFDILIKTNETGIFYIPNIGNFITLFPNTDIHISFINDVYVLKMGNHIIDFELEKTTKIHHHFEPVLYPINVLDEHFFDESGNIFPVEIKSITTKHLSHLTIALDCIQKYVPAWYSLLRSVTRKFVIFNDPTVKRNSFATQSVHGCGFFNAFQEDYNEVFFIEDIAHQGGHIIFNAYLTSKPDIFRVDKNTQIYMKGERDIYNEPRALYVMIHAMYTYESMFTCFNACLESGYFTGHKKHELNGRLTFALLKFARDLELLSEIDLEGKNIYLTEEGLLLIYHFQKTYEKCIANWGVDIVSMNLENQPYNFSYSKFLELNPLIENEVV